MKRNMSSYRLHTTQASFACIFVFIVSLFSTASYAQSRFSATINPGVNLPLKDLADADLKTGFGFEVNVAYRFLPHLAAYTGWGWSRFSADESFAGNKTDFEETGY